MQPAWILIGAHCHYSINANYHGPYIHVIHIPHLSAPSVQCFAVYQEKDTNQQWYTSPKNVSRRTVLVRLRAQGISEGADATRSYRC